MAPPQESGPREPGSKESGAREPGPQESGPQGPGSDRRPPRGADDLLGTLEDTLLATLGIEVLEVSAERVVATMPVGPRVHQPYGLLHGGASVALAESVASIGSSAAIDLTARRTVGLEINANHVRAVRSGVVTAVGTPLHVGRSTQLWAVEIRDEAGRLVCVSRCTLAVLDAPAPELGGSP